MTALIENIVPYIAEITPNQYTGFTYTDMRSCIKTVQGIHMCKPRNHGIGCLKATLGNRTHEFCKFRQIPSQNYLIGIRDNMFFCIIFKEVKIHIKTINYKTETLTLKSNGWLTLEQDGILTVDNLTHFTNSNCNKNVKCGQLTSISMPDLNLPN